MNIIILGLQLTGLRAPYIWKSVEIEDHLKVRLQFL